MGSEDERHAVKKDEERALLGFVRLGSVEYMLKAAQQFGCLLWPSSGLQSSESPCGFPRVWEGGSIRNSPWQRSCRGLYLTNLETGSYPYLSQNGGKYGAKFNSDARAFPPPC